MAPGTTFTPGVPSVRHRADLHLIAVRVSVVTIGTLLLLATGCGSSDAVNGTTPTTGAVGTTSTTKPGPTTTRGDAVSDLTTVTGTVTAGPIRSVERPGQVNTAPVTQGRVVARDGDGAEAARADISPTGGYRLRLPPGRYTLTPTDTGIMRCPPADLELPAGGGAASLDLACDTGIR